MNWAMALHRHLVVFARELRLGRGKRRLATRIGSVAAINFQRVALRALLRRLGRDPRWTTWVTVTPDRGRLPLLPPGVRLRAQGGGDLGERMRLPMRRPPKGLPPGPVVVIGSDIPDIRSHQSGKRFGCWNEISSSSVRHAMAVTGWSGHAGGPLNHPISSRR